MQGIFLWTVANELFLYMNFSDNPASIYLLKDNHRNNRTRCKTCSKLTIKTPELRQCRCSGFFFVNLNIFTSCPIVSIINFEHVIAGRKVFFIMKWVNDYIT